MCWTLPCETCPPPPLWCSHRLVALYQIKLQKISWEWEQQLRKKEDLVCFHHWLESQNAEEKDKKFLPWVEQIPRPVRGEEGRRWVICEDCQASGREDDTLRDMPVYSPMVRNQREREREDYSKNIIFYLKLFWSSCFPSCYCYFLVLSSISRWPLTFVQHVHMQQALTGFNPPGVLKLKQ